MAGLPQLRIQQQKQQYLQHLLLKLLGFLLQQLVQRTVVFWWQKSNYSAITFQKSNDPVLLKSVLLRKSIICFQKKIYFFAWKIL